MADEDALFAEFMGEIKSAVVESTPVAEGGVGAASDTASVGDANGEGGGGEQEDSTKRKGAKEVRQQ